MGSQAPDQRFAELQQRLRAGLDEAIPADRPVAFVDYPNHYNPGDCAIWAGERTAIEALDRDVAYVADQRSFSVRALDRLAPDATILVHGGGNFGDIYPSHQVFREQLAQICRHHRIVHLPQTIHFTDPELERRTARFLAGHPDSFLFARDERSHRRALQYGVPCALAPDSAIALAPLNPTSSVGQGTLWALRLDVERRESPHVRPNGSWTADWPPDPLPLKLVRYTPAFVHAKRGGPSTGPRIAILKRAFDWLANGRVRAGVDFLSQAERVVTDRLHAHILCTMLGIPNVLLDNSYGKNRSFYATWTDGLSNTRFASTPEEAQRMVDELPARAA